MKLLRMLAATAATGMSLIAASPQQTPVAKVLRFGHLWDGTRLIDNVDVIKKDGED